MHQNQPQNGMKVDIRLGVWVSVVNSCETYNNYPDNIADYHGKLYQKVDNFFEELQEKEGLLTFNSSCKCVRKSCLIW